MKSAVHPGAALVTPYTQGRLDALCGLYALINAIRVVHAVAEPLSGQSCRSLFRTGAEVLAANKRTRAVICDGMTAGAQRRLLKALTLHPILERRRPLKLADAKEKLKAEGIGQLVRSTVERGAVLLVSLEGRLSHHTVITGISAKKIILCDSIGMQFVLTSSLMPSTPRPSSLHIHNITQLGLARGYLRPR